MKCSFCGNEMVLGAGKLFVERDATAYYFCSSKCEKNLLKLRRGRRKTRWTARYRMEKEVRLAAMKEKKAGKEGKKEAAERAGKEKKAGSSEKILKIKDFQKIPNLRFGKKPEKKAKPRKGKTKGAKTGKGKK